MFAEARNVVFNHAVNPLARHLLRSPLRGRLGRYIGVLSYHGRVSGRAISLPVEYAWVDESMIAVVPGEPETKTWWRGFRSPNPVEVTIDGRVLRGQAVVLTDPAVRLRAWRAYLSRFAAAARFLGVHPDDSDEVLAQRVDDAVIVGITVE